jgi:hypothetical protein
MKKMKLMSLWGDNEREKYFHLKFWRVDQRQSASPSLYSLKKNLWLFFQRTKS